MFDDLSKKKQEKALKNGYIALFSERETMQEAYDYALNIVTAIEAKNRNAVLTAIHILTNTHAVIAADSDG